MADLKITQLVDGGAPQATDEFVIARAGDNFKVDWASLEAAAEAPYGLALLTNDTGNTLGGDEFIPLEVGFPDAISTAGYKTVSTGIPQTLGANGFILAQLYLPDALAATYEVLAQLEVSNADGSEKLVVANDSNPPWVAAPDAGVKIADFTGITFSVYEQIGSDLSRDVTATTFVKIKSAAGGQFFANLYAGFFIP